MVSVWICIWLFKILRPQPWLAINVLQGRFGMNVIFSHFDKEIRASTRPPHLMHWVNLEDEQVWAVRVAIQSSMVPVRLGVQGCLKPKPSPPDYSLMQHGEKRQWCPVMGLSVKGLALISDWQLNGQEGRTYATQYRWVPVLRRPSSSKKVQGGILSVVFFHFPWIWGI